MPMPQSPNRHPWDDAADEVTTWLNDESKYYAEALLAGHSAPFGAEGSASISERDKLEYYKRQVFNTNGLGAINYDSPNESGREALIKRLGIPGYTQVIAAVLAEKNKLIQIAAPPDYNSVDTEEMGGSY